MKIVTHKVFLQNLALTALAVVVAEVAIMKLVVCMDGAELVAPES